MMRRRTMLMLAAAGALPRTGLGQSDPPERAHDYVVYPPFPPLKSSYLRAMVDAIDWGPRWPRDRDLTADEWSKVAGTAFAISACDGYHAADIFTAYWLVKAHCDATPHPDHADEATREQWRAAARDRYAAAFERYLLLSRLLFDIPRGARGSAQWPESYVATAGGGCPYEMVDQAPVDETWLGTPVLVERGVPRLIAHPSYQAPDAPDWKVFRDPSEDSFVLLRKFGVRRDLEAIRDRLSRAAKGQK